MTPNIPITFSILLISSTQLHSNIISKTLSELTEASVGIRTTADFDWAETNLGGNAAYFEDYSNFFQGKGMVYNPNSPDHDFLNIQRMNIGLFDNIDKGGKLQKTFDNIPGAGFKTYEAFSSVKTYNLNANDTVSGMSAGTGNGIEKFEIFGGTAGSNMNVTMEVREKTAAESYGYHGPHSNNTVIGEMPLVSGVIRLHGMGIQAATSDGRVKTNPFALEATYTQEDYDATYSLPELQELINGCLFLGWLNTSLDGDPTSISDTDRWVHAIQGNYDNMPDNPNRFDEQGVIGDAYLGSLQQYIDGTDTSIAGLSKLAGEIRVGDHGGDHINNTVWAIVDHNSDFTVIPEPSTYAIIFGSIIGLLTIIRRKLS
tara:strand:- start:496 stop:1611 length:1116 start_codon:yes stop_codon:yes gene_type:complete